VLLEVCQRKRKAMIDPDERCHVLGEAFGQPLRNLAARPVLARARGRPCLLRRRISVRYIDSQPRKARCCGLCARVVDADALMGTGPVIFTCSDPSLERILRTCIGSRHEPSSGRDFIEQQ
jgi:hypothetical protein